MRVLVIRAKVSLQVIHHVCQYLWYTSKETAWKLEQCPPRVLMAPNQTRDQCDCILERDQ
jgi:hypothetical protein